MTLVLAHPFRLAGAHLAVVDDSDDTGFAQEIAVLAATRLGERPLVPDFGILDPTFGTVDVAELNRGLALFGPPGLAVTAMAVTVVDRSLQRVVLSFDSTPPPAAADDVFYD